MKFKEAAISNDTSPPIEGSETDKSVTNTTSTSTASNHKSSIVEKEKISSEGQIIKNKKHITTGTLISLSTSNQSSNSTKKLVTSREIMSKKIENSNSGEENKPDEHDIKSMKPKESKTSEENKSVETQVDKSRNSGNSNTNEKIKSEEPSKNKPIKSTETNSEENKNPKEQLVDKSRNSGNSNTNEKIKSEEPSENKPIKSTETNSDENKNPKEQLDGKSKENTKSKADEGKTRKQSQTNINDKFVGSRTSTQSISGNDKSEDSSIATDLNEHKDIIRKKSHEFPKNNNIHESDIVESSNSHFMVIIFIGLLFTIVAYIVFQKRKKIIAYVIEGRRRNSRDRRASGSKDTKVSYKPLDTEDKEAGINNYKYVY